MKKWKTQILFYFLLAICLAGIGVPAEAASKYDKFSNNKHGFGLAVNKVHKVPGNGEAAGFSKHNALYYVKTKKKKIYLTFDCGYENGNTGKILDELKKHNFKALFFVTQTYIRDNPKLVKRMKEEGHLVGNHTCTHPSLPSCSVEKVKKEILDCAKYMKEKTGYEMDKYLRPPMGEWSVRVLKVAKGLGYTSVFWSMAFYDYDVEKQPGADTIYRQFMEHYHKGAVVLFHVISKSDTEALSRILTDMKKKGYSFCIPGNADPILKKADVRMKTENQAYRRQNGELVQNFEITYPVITGEGKKKKVLNRDIGSFCKIERERAKTQYENTVKDIGEEVDISDLPKGHYLVQGKVTYNQDGFLSVKNARTIYGLGAANADRVTVGMVYNLNTGKRVSLAAYLGISKKKAHGRVKERMKTLLKKYGWKGDIRKRVDKLKTSDYTYFLTRKGKIRIAFASDVFGTHDGVVAGLKK